MTANNKEVVVKPFKFNEQLFMPYPQRKPKDMTPIKVLTTKNEVKNVIQIDTGFGREFVNETEKTLLFPDDIKGWWYI
jgi:hypothetical protein